MSVDFQSEDMAKQLVEIWEIQKDIKQQMEAGFKGKDWMENKIRELLEKAKSVAALFKASGMTVNVGFPFGASVSLSWELHRPQDQTSS